VLGAWQAKRLYAGAGEPTDNPTVFVEENDIVADCAPAIGLHHHLTTFE
jgi:hypothetical protein